MPDPTNPTAEARLIADSVTIEAWDDLMQQMRVIFGDIAKASGNDLLTQLGFTGGDPTFDKVAESTLEEAAARAAELIGKRVLPDGRVVENPEPTWAISDSTREMLFETLNDSFERGLSAGAIRNEIVDSYGFSANRALMIARTERSFAQQRGSLVAAKASGVVKGKKWTIASEHDQDDQCNENEDDGIIPVDEDFTSGDSSPPAHPNCSCILDYSTEDVPDEPDDDEEEAA